MGIFDIYGNGININEVISLREGDKKVWQFSLDHTHPVSLFVSWRDGSGINIDVMTDVEYGNFSRGLAYRVKSGLSYESIDSFDNTVNLGAGSYYLVASLPRILEGMESYAEAVIRCETLE